jgi:hypothetical protein
MTHHPDDRQKVLDRIQALLALAESTGFEGEARTSAITALRLMKKHGVSREDLAKEQLKILLRQNGSRGGRARARALSKEQLSEISQKGVKARQEKLSARARSRIAKKAAKTRWALAAK